MTEKIQKCPICETEKFSLFLEVRDYFLTKEDFQIQHCDSCGFKFVNPRPDKLSIERYYQSDEYISHDSQKVSLISRIYTIARRVSIRNKFNIVKGFAGNGKILDIGCGTGEFLNYCKSKNFEVAGVEPNSKASDFARRVNHLPVVSALNELESGKGTMNCITMWHVLEHVHDLNETLGVVKGLLNPNGVFIVAVPNCTSWDAQKYGKFWAAYDVPRHLYHFDKDTMKKLVTKHGFIILKTIPQKLDAYYVSLLSEKYQNGRNNYLKSFATGFLSNFMAGMKDRGHSSRIFVLSTKKT